MIINEEGTRKLQMLNNWQKTEKYEELCENKQQEIERLTQIGEQILFDICRIRESVQSNTVKVEYAVDGHLHRGFYCPSPILDLVVGNLKRGRILKRVTASSRISHLFGFDHEGRLVVDEFIHGNDAHLTEFILTRGNYAYGVTVNTAMELVAISEEFFCNQELHQYSYLLYSKDDEKNVCYSYHSEHYSYNSQGLSACVWEEYEPLTRIYREHYYEFQFENESLCSFSCIDCIQKYSGIYNEPSRYVPSKKMSDFDRFCLLMGDGHSQQ